MKIINKITGKDMTSEIIRKWEREYEEKGIKIKKSKNYEKK